MTDWEATFAEMKDVYSEGIAAAVRSQRFIKYIHRDLQFELDSRLTRKARREGVKVVLEAGIHGSFKDKDVDVSVIHPTNGPLVLVGVRSQMTSVGKNILTYTQDIIGECVSLQDRFPTSVYAYAYLLPLHPGDAHTIDYQRYARMFAGITGRGRATYKAERGRYDHFAFALVDFDTDPPTLHEDLVRACVSDPPLDLTGLTDRVIGTYKERNPWLDFFE